VVWKSGKSAFSPEINFYILHTRFEKQKNLELWKIRKMFGTFLAHPRKLWNFFVVGRSGSVTGQLIGPANTGLTHGRSRKKNLRPLHQTAHWYTSRRAHDRGQRQHWAVKYIWNGRLNMNCIVSSKQPTQWPVLSSSGIFHIQRSDSERSMVWRDFSKKTRTGQNLGKIRNLGIMLGFVQVFLRDLAKI
jgi:hypothetical protein